MFHDTYFNGNNLKIFLRWRFHLIPSDPFIWPIVQYFSFIMVCMVQNRETIGSPTSPPTNVYLFIYLIIYKIHLNAPRVVKVHHKEHQVNEPLARLL